MRNIARRESGSENDTRFILSLLVSLPQGKIIYSNGDFFEGMFKEGQIEGEGTLRCRNGLEYTGTWKHSQVLQVDNVVYSMFT